MDPRLGLGMERLDECAERGEHDNRESCKISAEALAPMLKPNSGGEECHSVERCT
jgi:hypothetical protein